MTGGAIVGDDGLARCPWASGDPINRDYHDNEWGVGVDGEAAHFQRLSLEVFQSGLSWLTILNKRPAFVARRALGGHRKHSAAGERQHDDEETVANHAFLPLQDRGHPGAAPRLACCKRCSDPCAGAPDPRGTHHAPARGAL